MSKDVLEVDGVVTEALPNAMFKVKLDGIDKEILCHISGKIRMNYLNCMD